MFCFILSNRFRFENNYCIIYYNVGVFIFIIWVSWMKHRLNVSIATTFYHDLFLIITNNNNLSLIQLIHVYIFYILNSSTISFQLIIIIIRCINIYLCIFSSIQFISTVSNRNIVFQTAPSRFFTKWNENVLSIDCVPFCFSCKNEHF